MIVALLALIVVAGMVAAVVPLFLPWPARLRFVLTTSAAEPWGAAGASAASLGLRAVVVTKVDGGAGWYVASAVVVQEPAKRFELIGTGPLASVAQLSRWAATGTPLLLVSGDDGDVSLHGPRHTVVGLWMPDGAAQGPEITHATRRPNVGYPHD